MSRANTRSRLLDHLELQHEELEVTTKTASVAAFSCKRPARRALPDHLPRECIIMPAPRNSHPLRRIVPFKLRRDIPETLEVIPYQR